MPSVLHARQELREGAAAVAEAEPQPGAGFHESAGDHAGDAQRAFEGEGHDVLDEPRPHHAIHEGGVLGVHEKGHVQFLGSLEETQELGLPQALAVDVAEQLDAVETQRLDPLELRRGQVHVLERRRTERVETVRRLVHHAHQDLVQVTRQVEPVPRLQPIGQELRHGRQYLTVHRVIGRGHLPQAARHGPAAVQHRAEVPARDHDVGRVRPGVVHAGPAVARGASSHRREVFRHHVGVDVDDHEGSSLPVGGACVKDRARRTVTGSRVRRRWKARPGAPMARRSANMDLPAGSV